MKTVTKGKFRIIDLDQTLKALIENIKNEDTEISQISRALSGYVTISDFYGKGKIKAINLMLQEEVFIQLSLGTLWDLTDENHSLAEQFVLALYGHKGENNVNLLRYKIYYLR